jgi:hypothetical protein
MQTTRGLRHHARFAVNWPILYSNQGLTGQGTVLDLSQIDVTVGMLLKLKRHDCSQEKEKGKSV